jgi:protein-S-isoprenylcysteine O-methyltransferase Ste14
MAGRLAMSDDMPYRMAVVLLFAGAITITAYHRLQAARSGERFDRRQEGLALAVVLRLAGLALFATTLLYLVRPETVEFSSLPLPAWLRWSGAGFGAGGVVLLYATLTNLGKNLTDTVDVRDAATLVTTGPYRWVRHPFYVSAALLMLGVSLLAANWLIALCGAVVLMMLGLRTPKEEAKLIERFGDDYRAYMATTGRFFPKLGS